MANFTSWILGRSLISVLHENQNEDFMYQHKKFDEKILICMTKEVPVLTEGEKTKKMEESKAKV